METYLPYNPNATQKKYESAQITNSLITLRHIPKEGSIVINNFTESSSANPAQGYFFCNYSADTFYRDANRTLIFNAADNNKTVSIEYIAVGTPFTAQDANEIKSHLENNSIHGASSTGMTFRGVFLDDTPADPANDDFSIINNQSYIYQNGYIALPHYSPFRGYSSSSALPNQSKFPRWKEQIPGNYESTQLVTEELYWGEYISEDDAPTGTIHPPKYTNGLRLWDGLTLRRLEGAVPVYVKNSQSGDESFDTGDIFPRYDDFYKLFIKLPTGQAKTQFRIDTPDDLEDQLQALTDRIAALENSSPSLQKKTKTLTLTEHYPPDNNDETDWDFYTQADLRSRYNDPSRIDPAQVILPASIQNWRILTYPGYVELDSSNPAVIDEICIGQFLDGQIDQDKLAERDFFWENGFGGLIGYGFLESGTEYRSDDSEFVRFVINPEVFQFLMPFQSQIVVEYEELT